MVGTTMLALAGISAGAKAIGAWNSHRAANKAGKQQAVGADQARGVVDAGYQTQMGLMDPYAAMGRQGANTLGRLMTPGVPYTPQLQAADARAMMPPPPPPPGTAVPRGSVPPGGLGRLMPRRPM
jgi:hypothetical protein